MKSMMYCMPQVAPAVVGASLEALQMLKESTELRDRLMANTARFRLALTEVLYLQHPNNSSVVHKCWPACDAKCGLMRVSQGHHVCQAVRQAVLLQNHASKRQ